MGTYEYTETTGDPRLLALAFFSILKDFLWDRTRLVFFGLMSVFLCFSFGAFVVSRLGGRYGVGGVGVGSVGCRCDGGCTSMGSRWSRMKFIGVVFCAFSACCSRVGRG